MFGTDPALLQQALQQQQQQSWQQDVQSSPFELMQRAGNQAGGMLGNALGAATGYVDPRIADAQLMQKVQQESLMEAQAQGINPAQDPAGFGKVMANKYLQIGKPDKAYAVLQQIQGMEKAAAETAKAQAEAKSKLREKQYTVVGKNVIDNATGQWVTPPAGGIDVNNQYDVVQFLNQYNELVKSGQPIPQGMDNYAKGLAAIVSRPQIAANGSVIEPIDVGNVFPEAFGKSVSNLDKSFDPTKPGAAETVEFAKQVKDLTDKGVDQTIAEQAVLKRTNLGKPPISPSSYKVGSAVVTPDPYRQQEELRKDAFKIEQQLSDDFNRIAEKRKGAIDAADRAQELLKDPKNPTAVNAAATIGQHIIEPSNQALQNEINRLMGGGNAWEQAQGVVSKITNGVASDQQIKWFTKFAETLRKVELNKYKLDAQNYTDKASSYAEGNPLIKPSNVVSARSLAAYEKVPYITTDDEFNKLPKGTEFYTNQDLKKRRK